jgi:hypothetical protein
MAQREDADQRRLIAELAVLGQGAAPDLQRRLGVSQATFSRLARRLDDRLLVIGKARARRSSFPTTRVSGRARKRCATSGSTAGTSRVT